MKKHLDTLLIHGAGDHLDSRAAVAPIHRSTVWALGQGDVDYHDVVYPRLNNLPGQVAVGAKLAALEQTESGLVTASGMAAISAALLVALGAGGHLIAQSALYGGTHTFVTHELPGLGFEHTLVDLDADDDLDAHLRPNTRAIYVETMTNPTLAVADHRAVVDFARRNGLVSIIDNTFASPVGFRPATLGYDVVVHSCTKSLNGHSDVVAGAVLGGSDFVRRVKLHQDHFGGCLDPHACYLLDRGLKTLALRVERQQATALTLARWLEAHPAIERVLYPGLESHPHHARARELFDGFGTMLALELVGGAEAARRLISRLQIFFHGPSLGGVESLVTRPATSSHAGMSPEERAAVGVTEGLVRVSVGIEHVDDLVADLEQALR